MEILITGGSGFIGSHLVKKLVEKGFNIIVLVRDLNSVERLNEFKDKLIIYDSTTSLNEIFEKYSIELVIHLATNYKKDHSPEDIKEMIKINITLPSLILEEMSKKKIKYFINTGTFFEYNLSKNYLISEENIRSPYNFYSSLKIAFTDILKYYCNNKGIKAIDLKLFSPYGPKDNEKLITFLIKSFLTNQVVEVTKGEQILSWTYVEDIVEAYIKSIDYIFKMQKNLESFNIGSDANYVKEIFRILEEISGKPNLIRKTREYQSDEIMYAKCNNGKAKTLLNWSPSYSLREGLKKTYDYYKNGI